jgi:hypothetical protein
MRAKIVIALTLLMLLSSLLAGCSQEKGTADDQQNVSLSQNTLSGGAECPRGVEDDPYPGSCGLYVDKNNDGFCDLGQ